MTIIKLHQEPLQEEWLDAYGHMNVGYYLVPFGRAMWPLMDYFDAGVEYFKQTGCAFYTVESHLRYVKEIRTPALLEIEGMVLQSDAKRCRYGMIMNVDGVERATCEYVDLHLDESGRSAPMPEPMQQAMRAAQVGTLPEWAGRNISLDRKR